MSTAAAQAAAQAAACTNCEAAIHGDFCSACGERQPGHHDLSVRHFFREWLDEVAHFDSKVPRTLTYLVSRPGFLAREYFAGRKSRYILPLRLFLVIFALNFFLYTSYKPTALYDITRIEKAEGSGTMHAALERFAHKRNTTVEVVEEKITHRWQRLYNLMEVLSVFIMALVAAGFFYKLRPYFVQHLVFSFHFLTFTTLLSTVIFPIYVVFKIDPMQRGAPFVVVQFSIWLLYMWKAIQCFYGVSKAGAAWRALVLLLGGYLSMVFVVVVSMLTAVFSVVIGS